MEMSRAIFRSPIVVLDRLVEAQLEFLARTQTEQMVHVEAQIRVSTGPPAI